MRACGSAWTLAGLDRLVVYADREHSANLAYLTGFDPRFEEAILVVGPDGDPAILVGNECFGMAGAAPLPMRRELFQDLSLPGQPRDRSRSLAGILADEGIAPGSRVGVIGWKTYADAGASDAPSYLVDELRSLVGATGEVVNATGLLIDAADGLRVINEVEQLAAMEWAACQTSQGVRNLLFGAAPGPDRARGGAPARVERLAAVVPSHADRGRAGALRAAQPGRSPHRARRPVHGRLRHLGRAELPRRLRRWKAPASCPTASATTSSAWWRRTSRRSPSGTARSASVRSGGVLHEIVARRLGDPFFGIFLNPGHQIHLDEWVNSPISPGSTVELRSGMAFQVDVIPATGTPYFTTNIEDGIALADASLRDTFARAYPDAWRRIQARRAYMADALGIELHPDVLPFSNIPAHLPPFLLRPDRAMTDGSAELSASGRSGGGSAAW